MYKPKRILYYIIFAAAMLLLPAAANAQRTEKEFNSAVENLFKSQKWEEGKSILDRGLSRYNESSLLRTRLGQYYMHHANYDAARYQLEKALKFDIDNDNARRYLVQVEMDTKRYSIALCYVNELLENFPYDKQLWLKKISIFLFSGDFHKANAYMKRLSEIYYKDSEIFDRYMNQLQETALRLKRKGDVSGAIVNYEIIIDKGAASVDDYLDIINLYLQRGNEDRAVFYSDRSVMQYPDSVRVIGKKAGIMSVQGRYDDALSFLRMKMRTVPSDVLRKQYNDMLLEYGDFDKAKKYDIYREAFGSMPGNSQILNYLIDASFQKGYYENALGYIDAAEKRGHLSKELLAKKYQALILLGDKRKANSLLERLFKEFPDDYDIRYNYTLLKLDEAKSLVLLANYGEAIPLLEFVAKNANDDEIKYSAYNHLFTCYLKQGNAGKAKEVAEEISRLYPGKAKNSEIAEEITLPYVKSLMEIGATERALFVLDSLLTEVPNNDQALRYAVNATAQLKLYGDNIKYIRQGESYYPGTLFYKLKEAQYYNANKNFDEALFVEKPLLEEYRFNTELVNTHTETRHSKALRLAKEKAYEEAIAQIDTALKYDPSAAYVKFDKGVIYEAMQQYDSAYVYQAVINPTNAEQRDWELHMKYLKYRTYKNDLSFGYTIYDHLEKDMPDHFASVEYKRESPSRNNVYIGSLNYSGRNENRGFQLGFEWFHTFSHSIYTDMDIAWSNKYFNNWTVNAKVFKGFKNDWELGVGVGYRRTQSETDIFNLYLSTSKEIRRFVRTEIKGNIFYIDKSLYYNIMGEARFYVLDHRKSWISALAGVGSAPETELLDHSIYNFFSGTNILAGASLTHLFTERFSGSLTGTWNNYKYDADQYWNLLILSIKLNVLF